MSNKDKLTELCEEFYFAQSQAYNGPVKLPDGSTLVPEDSFIAMYDNGGVIRFALDPEALNQKRAIMFALATAVAGTPIRANLIGVAMLSEGWMHSAGVKTEVLIAQGRLRTGESVLIMGKITRGDKVTVERIDIGDSIDTALLADFFEMYRLMVGKSDPPLPN